MGQLLLCGVKNRNDEVIYDEIYDKKGNQKHKSMSEYSNVHLTKQMRSKQNYTEVVLDAQRREYTDKENHEEVYRQIYHQWVTRDSDDVDDDAGSDVCSDSLPGDFISSEASLSINDHRCISFVPTIENYYDTQLLGNSEDCQSNHWQLYGPLQTKTLHSTSQYSQLFHCKHDAEVVPINVGDSASQYSRLIIPTEADPTILQQDCVLETSVMPLAEVKEETEVEAAVELYAHQVSVKGKII